MKIKYEPVEYELSMNEFVCLHANLITEWFGTGGGDGFEAPLCTECNKWYNDWEEVWV